MHVRLFPDLLPLLAVLIILSGCSPFEETSHASFPPPAVKTITVAGEDMPLKKDYPGRLLFSSAVVDETTGQVLLRAEFENPQGKLLPGTYVRVRVTEGVAHQAVLVPQRAVQWDTLGQASVMTVRDGKAAAQPILTSRSVGNRWLVNQGLKSGDQVIVDGLDRAMPGQPVSAAPAEAAAEKAAERGTASDCSAAEPCDIPS